MQITVSQRALRDALEVVARASAGPRTALPVLANVLLSVPRVHEGKFSDRLELTATNLEIAVTCWLDAQITQPGAITVPTRTLVDLTCTASQRSAVRRRWANTFTAENVALTLDQGGQTLALHSGYTRANLCVAS